MNNPSSSAPLPTTPPGPPKFGPKIPKPETTRAYLMSAGISRPTPTVHHFLESRLTTLKILDANGDAKAVSAYEYIYRCFRTGADRRWGVYVPSAEPDRAEPSESGEDTSEETDPSQFEAAIALVNVGVN